MTLDEVRAAAIDRALVGEDPESALTLAGAADRVTRRATNDRMDSGDGVAHKSASSGPRTATPLAAAMLTVTCLAAERTRPLGERAWQPGRATDSLVVAGAAAAVRTRNVGVDRAAELADCAPATLAATVDWQRRREKER